MIKRKSLSSLIDVRRQTLMGSTQSGGAKNSMIAIYDNLSTIFDQEPPSMRVGINLSNFDV
jgi:hypothetical protein